MSCRPGGLDVKPGDLTVPSPAHSSGAAHTHPPHELREAETCCVPLLAARGPVGAQEITHKLRNEVKVKSSGLAVQDSPERHDISRICGDLRAQVLVLPGGTLPACTGVEPSGSGKVPF